MFVTEDNLSFRLSLFSYKFDVMRVNLRLYLIQVELSHPDAELRILEVFYHKIYKVTSGFLFFYIVSQ